MERLRTTIFHIRRMLAGETPRILLTEEQHRKYKHLCGLTGEELEKVDWPELCARCLQREKCLRDHAILGVDW